MASFDRAPPLPPLMLPVTAPTNLQLREFNPRVEKQPAKREDDDHKLAMAVLAYHHKWDNFVNKELENTWPLHEFDENLWNRQPERYVAIFAFFCPLDLLNGLLDADRQQYNNDNGADVRPLRSDQIEIHVPEYPPPPEYEHLKQPACALSLFIKDTSAKANDAIAKMIADIISEAGRNKHSNEAFAWRATIIEIIMSLYKAAARIAPWSARLPAVYQLYAPPSLTKTLMWRGMIMEEDTYDSVDGLMSAADRMAAKMSERFVSTTENRMSTRSFVGAGFADPGAAIPGRSWQLCLLIDSDVKVINVANYLPKGWQCFDENEFIIAPGAHYTIKSWKLITDEDVGHVDVDVPLLLIRDDQFNAQWEVGIRRFVVNVSSRPPIARR